VHNHDFRPAAVWDTTAEDADKDCLEAFVPVVDICISSRSTAKARLDTPLATNRLANKMTCAICKWSKQLSQK